MFTDLGPMNGNHLGHLSNRVNLDDLFGNVFDTAFIEPVTPFKLAAYVLIRTLHTIHHEVHFFPVADANRIHCLLYGLLESGERPYSEIKRVVRYLDKTVWQGIYAGFIYSVECIIRGCDLVVTIDNILPLGNSKPTDGQERLFVNRNFICLWLRKLHFHWSQMTTQQVFNIYELFRAYLQDLPPLNVDNEKKLAGQYFGQLPPEIDSSSRARRWIDTQMHLLQVCPSMSLGADEMFLWCNSIKEIHRDIQHVYLLDMLNHIRLKNSMAAQESLRMFFDLSMFRPNVTGSVMFNSMEHKRLGTIDQKPLRYGTLLLARLYRMFGDHKMARSLLTESVQQAQSQGDCACLRLAMVELAAIETMGYSKSKKSDHESNAENDDVPLVTMDSVMSILQHEQVINESDNSKNFESDSKDFEDLQLQLVDISQLLSSVAAARAGNFGDNPGTGISRALRSTSSDDFRANSRLISDASAASLSSMRLQQGFWKASRTAALSLTEANGGDGIATHHETEAYAVAGVNIVYSYMAEGKWELASQSLTDVINKFPDHYNWQAANHVSICKNIFYFDNAFRLGRWKELDEKIEDLKSVCPEEATIRHALLLAQRGELQTAEDMLKKELQHVDDKAFVYRLRVQMQLASVLCALHKYDDALDNLMFVIEQAKTKGMLLMSAMAERRRAMLHVMTENWSSAKLEYDSCFENILSMASELEKCLYHFGYAKIKLAEKEDPLYHLAYARKYCQQAGFPILEKAILKDIGVWFNKTGDLKRRDDICEQFVCLDEVQSGFMDWMLF